MRLLEDFIKPTQSEMFKLLCSKYKNKELHKKDSFILVKGKAPVLLVAHMDTVHKSPVKDICISADGNILMSPQGIGGDDRCGIYALNKIYRKSKIKPWLLFTCDEEIGGKGAEEFCRLYSIGKLPYELHDIKCIIEIDRRGSNDAVYYNCANAEFIEYITHKGFITQFGTYSDISSIAPIIGVAAVNLSSGYYNEHTMHEYIVRSELEYNIDRIIKIVSETVRVDFPQYPYIGDFIDILEWSEYNDIVDRRLAETLPDDILGMYEELLEIYYPDELSEYIATYGDSFIKLLYKVYYGDQVEAEKANAQLYEMMGEDLRGCFM